MTAAPSDGRPLPTVMEIIAAEFGPNPHDVLDDLRKRAPMHKDEMGRILLTRAADVEAVLRDRELSVDGRKAPADSFMRRIAQTSDVELREPSMLFLDDPDHARLRGLVNKAFTPRAVERMGPRIQEITDELLDTVNRTFDLIGDFSAPLPTIVIAEMLGVDAKDQKQFKAWSDLVVMNFDPFLSKEQREKVEEAGRDLDAYLGAVVEERRADRRADLISGLIEAEEDGDQLNDDEIVRMIGLLLGAGNLTTTDLIGNGVLALLQSPDQLALLQADPTLINNAVEEMLRYDPPVTMSGRLVLKDTVINGCPFSGGQSISPMLKAANHDPALNADPHRFDITRTEIHHTSFGGGRRYCLGAPLARLEAQIAVGTLVRRFPALRLTGSELKWRTIPAFRGLISLPVAVD